MAHFAGLVAGTELASPFDHCHMVTTTTHKSLRGPRGAMIFFRNDQKEGIAADLENRVNQAVFPTCQGGPHNNAIAAIAVQLKEVCGTEWKQYSRQIRLNAKALASALMAKGYKLATGGTDNHLILWDLRPVKVSGSKFESLCDYCSITLNKNSINGDRSAVTPGGVRVGTPALTSRGFNERDFVAVGEFLHRALVIAIELQARTGEKLAAFKDAFATTPALKALRADVEAFAKAFPMPGFEVSGLKYKE